jgi:PAS domain S-box-containing protein
MLTVVVLTCAVLFQFLAVLYALRLIKLTGRAYFWIFISLALCLMMVRRLIPLYDVISTKLAYPIDLPNEFFGLLLSIFMFLGIVGIKEIFIARNKAEEKAKLSAQNIHYLSKYANDFIILLDENFRFIEVNERVIDFYGYTREELIGMHASHLRVPETRKDFMEQITLAPVSGKTLYETIHQRKDGSRFPVEISVRAIDSDGKKLYLAVIRDISERRQAENELQIAHQRLLDIIEFIPDATFVIDKDKKVIAWNRALEKMTGIPKQDIIGKGDYAYSIPFYGKLRPIIIDLIGKDDPETQALYDKFEKIDNIIYGEVFVPGLYNGRGAYVLVTASPLIDASGNRYGAIETVRNITERKEYEKALQESEQKYRELVEHANSIILHWTRDGRITFLNEFGQRFFGYAADEIIGRHVIGTIVPAIESDGRDLTRLMEQIRLDPVAFERNINENLRRNGERVWIAWTNRIVHDTQGRVAEILSIGTDITELKQAEETIRELNTGLERRVAERTAELAVAMDRAQAADRIKSAFLASMSHELRTPLNSIIGFTGMVLQGLAGPLNEEQTKQLGMVRGSARHLLDLINDILDISKIEAGQFNILSENFDLRGSIEKTVKIISPLADKKNILLHSRIEDNISDMRGDQRRVEQIILNLLSNAVKFTDHGEIHLNCYLDNGFVTLSVEDTGIGIKPENINIIFEAFRQVDAGTARTQEGTGLGLNITKKLIEMMGGSIHVISEWEKGSTFTVILPITKER